MPTKTPYPGCVFLNATGLRKRRRSRRRRRRRRRSRSPRGPYSRVPQLVEAVLVDAEVVRELGRVVAEVLEQRLPIDRDPRGQVLGLVEKAVQVGLVGISLLDHDGDVL